MGTAWVAGHDVLSDPQAVRRSIGLSGQYAAVDETQRWTSSSPGTRNLYLVARLCGMSNAQAKPQAKEALRRFRLDEADGLRRLFGNTIPGAPPPAIFPARHPVLYTVIASLVIIAMFAPLAVAKYSCCSDHADRRGQPIGSSISGSRSP